MTMKICEHCTYDRSQERYAEASKCFRCKGTGLVRIRESWICNGCGGCLCPDDQTPNREIPHGLIDACVDGGYSSTQLCDTKTYTFSMCEVCLRALFAGFKVPTKVGEYLLSSGDRLENTEPYEKEIATATAYRAKQEVDRKVHEDLIANHQCTEVDHDQRNTPYCAEPAVLDAYHGDHRYPRCLRHGRDCYATYFSLIHVDGRDLTLQWRSDVGKRYLAAFLQNEPIRPSDEHEAAIFVSTLFSLLLRPETYERAVSEIIRISKAFPREPTEWVGNRVPLAFPPSMVGAAAVANIWLAWGEQQGYANAVAHALLGRSASSLWDESK